MVLVLTADDVPVNEYGLTMNDQPVFIGATQSGRSAVPSNVSRWEADHLALVVAETAKKAAKNTPKKVEKKAATKTAKKVAKKAAKKTAKKAAVKAADKATSKD